MGGQLAGRTLMGAVGCAAGRFGGQERPLPKPAVSSGDQPATLSASMAAMVALRVACRADERHFCCALCAR